MNKQQLTRGCIVFMKSSSGLKGYGNEQCISSVINDETISLFGHNEHYHIYDIREVIYYPSSHESEVKILGIIQENEKMATIVKDCRQSIMGHKDEIAALEKENDVLRKQIVNVNKYKND